MLAIFNIFIPRRHQLDFVHFNRNAAPILLLFQSNGFSVNAGARRKGYIRQPITAPIGFVLFKSVTQSIFGQDYREQHEEEKRMQWIVYICDAVGRSVVIYELSNSEQNLADLVRCCLFDHCLWSCRKPRNREASRGNRPKS